jgi:predicted enzyme related to lactoylglutathione lyase
MQALTPMIFAKDLARMERFYRHGFDLEVALEESSEGYRVLSGDGIRMSLHAIPDHVAARIKITEPPAARSDTPIKLLFGVDDVASTRAHLEALGGQGFDTTTDDAADVLDPEGNVIQVRRDR